MASSVSNTISSTLPPTPTRLDSAYATVPGLFPRRSINLIIGLPKSGRLRFALTHLNTYADPLTPLFLDHPLHRPPEQLGCVLCGKDQEQIWNRVREMGLDNLTTPQSFPIIRWQPSKAIDQGEMEFPLDAPFTKLTIAAGRKPTFLLIEGLQLLMARNEQNEQQAVAIFMDRLQEFANQQDCTILGTVGTPKINYGNLPHRISGAAQWGEGTATLLGIDPVKATAKNGLTKPEAHTYRMLTLKPSGRPEETHWTRFTSDGRLVITDPPQASILTGQPLLDQMLALAAPGRYSMRDFIEWGEKADASPRTVRRWVESNVMYKYLVKEGGTSDAVYVKRSAQLD